VPPTGPVMLEFDAVFLPEENAPPSEFVVWLAACIDGGMSEVLVPRRVLNLLERFFRRVHGVGRSTARLWRNAFLALEQELRRRGRWQVIGNLS